MSSSSDTIFPPFVLDKECLTFFLLHADEKGFFQRITFRMILSGLDFTFHTTDQAASFMESKCWKKDALYAGMPEEEVQRHVMTRSAMDYVRVLQETGYIHNLASLDKKTRKKVETIVQFFIRLPRDVLAEISKTFPSRARLTMRGSTPVAVEHC